MPFKSEAGGPSSGSRPGTQRSPVSKKTKNQKQERKKKKLSIRPYQLQHKIASKEKSSRQDSTETDIIYTIMA